MCVIVIIKMFWPEEDKVTLKGKQEQRPDLSPGSKRKYPEDICLYYAGVSWLRPIFMILEHPPASKRYSFISSPSGRVASMSTWGVPPIQGRVQAQCTRAELDCVRWRERPGRR